MHNENNPIPDPRKLHNRDENNNTPENAVNTKQGTDKTSGADVAQRDEKESYTDYNGNSEENNPSRAGN